MSNDLVLSLFFVFFQTVKKLPQNIDRQLNGVSLGSLLVLVLTRTIQHHLSQLRVSPNSQPPFAIHFGVLKPISLMTFIHDLKLVKKTQQ